MSAALDIFAKDDTHPIPDLDVCDVDVKRKDGGHDLYLVIASPLNADERSQHRLIEKISRYLGFLAGLRDLPDEGTRRITVHIHPDSAPEIFDLLERCRPWTADNNVVFEVKRLPNQSPAPPSPEKR